MTPDKGAVMFKVFVTDKEGMVNFVSGQNPATTAIFDECVEKTQLWDVSEVHI